LERNEELNESTVCVVSIDRHELVSVVGVLLRSQDGRVLWGGVDDEIVLLHHYCAHRVLIVVYFKLVCLLGTEIAKREFFVVALDLHKYEQ